MPEDFSNRRLSTAVASPSLSSPQQGLGRITGASETDKIDNLTRALQRIENRLIATQGLQAPQPAGWQFKEVIWRKDNPHQTFAEEASNGWTPIASDCGLGVTEGQYGTHMYHRDPQITFRRPLSSKLVCEMQAEAAEVAHKDAQKRFEAKRETLNRKSGILGLIDKFRHGRST